MGWDWGGGGGGGGVGGRGGAGGVEDEVLKALPGGGKGAGTRRGPWKVSNGLPVERPVDAQGGAGALRPGQAGRWLASEP